MLQRHGSLRVGEIFRQRRNQANMVSKIYITQITRNGENSILSENRGKPKSEFFIFAHDAFALKDEKFGGLMLPQVLFLCVSAKIL